MSAYRCNSSRKLAEQHFDVFDDRVALALIVERVFLGALDRVLEHVEHTAEARRLALGEQLLAAAGHEHRPHVRLGLRQIEQLPAVGAVAHLDDPLARAVVHVRERARRNIDVRIVALLGGDDHVVGQADDAAHRFLVARRELRRHCLRFRNSAAPAADYFLAMLKIFRLNVSHAKARRREVHFQTLRLRAFA